MKKVLLSTIILMSLTCCPSAQSATKKVRLKVIETSDVHGHFFPYDFMEKKPIKGTLVRANTYINKQRREYGDNLLLIDNGDILQGQPCVYWSNYVMPEDENLAAQVINYMKYDAETVGNHDIEPGHKVYDKWIREVCCPCWVPTSSRRPTRTALPARRASIRASSPTPYTIRTA